MFKFEYTPPLELKDRWRYPTVTISVDSSADLLAVVQAFETYLRAAGFVFSGYLDLVDHPTQEQDFSPEEN